MQDAAAERISLAGVYQYGADAWADVSDILSVDSYVIDTHQVIYRCYQEIFKDDTNAKVDYTSIISASNSLGLSSFLQKKNEQEVLKAIIDTPVHLSNVRKAAVKVLKLHVARQLDAKVEEGRNNLSKVTGDESIDDILSAVEAPIFDFTAGLSGNKGNEPVHIGEGLLEYIKHIAGNPVTQLGLSTGYPIFDRAIGGGLRNGAISVIAARRKEGKSLLADNIAVNVNKDEILPVLMLDTEMEKEEHWHRLLAMISGVPIELIETGQFSKSEDHKRKIWQAMQQLQASGYTYQSIKGLPFDESLSIVRRWLMRKVGLGPDGKANPCLIILDYLKLMSSESITKQLSEYQVFGFMMTSLHNFIGKYGVPCVAFIQLNREKEVAQSDRVEWLCSNLSYWSKKTHEDIDEEMSQGIKMSGNTKLSIGATRHGAGLDEMNYINFQTDFSIGRITELKTRDELYKNKTGFEVDMNDDLDL